MRTVLLLGFLIGAAVSSPVGLKNYLDDDDGYTMTRSEIAMASLNLPSNATSIRADITDGFTCENRPYGYYADVENDCQIFHVCLPVTYPDGRENMFRWSFICPEETVFSQESFTCVRNIDMAFDCDDSESFYELNRRFGINPDDSIEIPDFDGQTKRFGEKTRPVENKNQRRPALKTPAPTRKPVDQPILPLYNRRIPARFGETKTTVEEVELPVEEEGPKETPLSELASSVFAPPNAVLKSVIHENVAEFLPTENIVVPVQPEGGLNLLKSEAIVEDKPEAEEPMPSMPMLEEAPEKSEMAMDEGQEKSVLNIDLPKDEVVQAAEIEVPVPEVKLDMDMKAEETVQEVDNKEIDPQLSSDETVETVKAAPLESTVADSLPEETKAEQSEPLEDPKENLVGLKTELLADSEPAETSPVETAPVEELKENLKSESLEEPQEPMLEPAQENSENLMQTEQEPALSSLKSHLPEPEMPVEVNEEAKEEVKKSETLMEEQSEDAVSLKSSNVQSDEPMEAGHGSTDEIPIPAQLPEETEMPKDTASEMAAPVEEMSQDTPLLKLSDDMNAESEPQKDKEESPESGETLHDSVPASSDAFQSEVLPTVAYERGVGVAPEVAGENHFLKAGDAFSPPYPMFNKEMMIPVRIVTDGEFPEDFYRRPELFKDSAVEESKPVDAVEEVRSELKEPEPTQESLPETSLDEEKVESLPSTEEMLNELAETLMRISEETAKNAEEADSASLQTAENKPIPVAEMILNNAPVANEETPMVKDLPKEELPEKEESLDMPEEAAKFAEPLPEEAEKLEETEKLAEPLSEDSVKPAESQPEEAEKVMDALPEETEKSDEPMPEEAGKSAEPAEALPAETVITAELLTEEDGKSGEPMPEEAQKSVEPLVEESLPEEAAAPAEPLPEEAEKAVEPLLEEAVKSVEPLPEEPIEAAEPTPEETQKSEEPLADEAGKAAELLSEETVEAAKPEETAEPAEALTEEAGKSAVEVTQLDEAATVVSNPEESEALDVKTVEVAEETPSLELKSVPVSDEEPKLEEVANVEPEMLLKSTEEKTEDEALPNEEAVQPEQEAVEMKMVEEPEYAPPADMLRTETFSAQDHELPFVVSFNKEHAPEEAEPKDALSDDSVPSLTKLLQTEDAEFLGSPASSESASSPLQDETPQALAKSADSQEESQKVAEESLKSDIDVNNSVFNVVHNAESIPAEPIPEESPKEAARSLRYKMDPRKRRFLFRP